MNIVIIRWECVPEATVRKYNLVSQSHDESKEWYKIVLMDHVDIEYLKNFNQDMISCKSLNSH